MNAYQIELRVERARRSGIRSKDLTTALEIYARLTPLHDRTNTNEILYWQERYNSVFDDELYLFLIYVDDEVAGYAQCLHFKSKRIVVLDYVIIEPSRQNAGLYILVLQAIVRHFSNAATIDFFVTELTKLAGQHRLSPEEFYWQETLKLTGFKTAHAPYKQPPLGLDNYESDSPGYLLILPTSSADAILRETYISIVHLIYFDHYFRWYEPFLAETKATYSDVLRKNLSEIESELASRELIQLNGTKGAISSTALPEIVGSLEPKRAGWIYFVASLVIFGMFLLVPLISPLSFPNLITAAFITYAIVITFFYLRTQGGILPLFSSLQKLSKLFDK